MSILPTPLIIIPCYNEEEILHDTLTTLRGLLPTAHFLCVDDGSVDKTWAIISREHQTCPAIKGVKLAKNYGQQEALLTGLFWAANRYECTITIDADLQDDPTLILKMVEQFHQGIDLVLGVRSHRELDSRAKRWSARLFYWCFRKRLLPQHADFRLMSREAVKRVLAFQPEKPFLRRWVLQLGLPYEVLYYRRQKRVLGHSKYNLAKMVNLAWRVGRPLKENTSKKWPYLIAEELA